MTEQNTPPDETIEVVHQPEQRRFAITVNGELAGFTEYREREGGQVLDYVHTEIDPAFGGRGLGGRLVAEAMERTRDLGRAIIPHCPFVAAWLKKHPEFSGDVRWPEERDR